MADDLQKKIAQLREKYTFEEDKQLTYAWEKKVREMMVRKDLKKLDGIKQFLSELETMVKEMSILLSWGKEITEEERRKLFVRREVYLWVYSFFENPSKVVEGIRKKVEEELRSE